MTLLGPAGFDARKERPMRDFEALPAGTYLAAIVTSGSRSSERSDTKGRSVSNFSIRLSGNKIQRMYFSLA